MAQPDHTPGIFQRGCLLRAQQLRRLSLRPPHHPARGLWAFARKQLLRIYLGYWPVLLLALTTLPVYGESMPTPRKVVMSTLLLYPNIWDNWLAPAWSLSVELYFYLWIALLTPVPREYRVRAITCTMAALPLWGTGWLLADHQRATTAALRAHRPGCRIPRGRPAGACLRQQGAPLCPARGDRHGLYRADSGRLGAGHD